MKIISKIREKLSRRKLYRFFKKINEAVEKKVSKENFMGVRIICCGVYICALTFCLKVGFWLASAVIFILALLFAIHVVLLSENLE